MHDAAAIQCRGWDLVRLVRKLPCDVRHKPTVPGFYRSYGMANSDRDTILMNDGEYGRSVVKAILDEKVIIIISITIRVPCCNMAYNVMRVNEDLFHLQSGNEQSTICAYNANQLLKGIT